MASAQDVPIKETSTGVRVRFGDLYIYPDGHANLTFRAVPELGSEKINMPLSNAVDVIAELTAVVKHAHDMIVKKRPGSA